MWQKNHYCGSIVTSAEPKEPKSRFSAAKNKAMKSINLVNKDCRLLRKQYVHACVSNMQQKIE